MALQAARLIIITDRHATNGRPVVDVVARALAGAGSAAGRVDIQLREKDLSARMLLDLAHQLRAVTRVTGSRLLINERIDVALAANADGVHLGNGALSIADVRAIAPGLTIGVSTHQTHEIQAAANAGADFVVYGPVFETPTKTQAVGLAALRAATRAPIPVLALGGIDAGNVTDCLAAGAAGIACIRAIMTAADPASVTSTLLHRFDVPREAFIS